MNKPVKYYFAIFFLILSANVSSQILITHPDNSISQLSKKTMRSIFAMRTPHWPNGLPIQVFVLDDQAPIHISFCKHLLGMFPYQLRRVWDRQVFSGTGIAPITVKTEQEMINRVATTQGAIGYIMPENMTSSIKSIGEL